MSFPRDLLDGRRPNIRIKPPKLIVEIKKLSSSVIFLEVTTRGMDQTLISQAGRILWARVYQETPRNCKLEISLGVYSINKQFKRKRWENNAMNMKEGRKLITRHGPS